LVSFTPRLLYFQGKNPWYPLDRRLGGLQSRSGRGGEDKNSEPQPGLEPRIIQPVAQRYTTELPQLLYNYSYSENCSLAYIASPENFLKRKENGLCWKNRSLKLFFKISKPSIDEFLTCTSKIYFK
jgi:hypothetical protein